mmetsp:Transcript_13878/g.30953  ORF Transcript_13878/g.30953 Transcript_13878/m.30953 type:complete len:666 (-) Transcript_13878:489-2486(-)
MAAWTSRRRKAPEVEESLSVVPTSSPGLFLWHRVRDVLEVGKGRLPDDLRTEVKPGTAVRHLGLTAGAVPAALIAKRVQQPLQPLAPTVAVDHCLWPLQVMHRRLRFAEGLRVVVEELLEGSIHAPECVDDESLARCKTTSLSRSVIERKQSELSGADGAGAALVKESEEDMGVGLHGETQPLAPGHKVGQGDGVGFAPSKQLRERSSRVATVARHEELLELGKRLGEGRHVTSLKEFQHRRLDGARLAGIQDMEDHLRFLYCRVPETLHGSRPGLERDAAGSILIHLLHQELRGAGTVEKPLLRLLDGLHVSHPLVEAKCVQVFAAQNAGLPGVERHKERIGSIAIAGILHPLKTLAEWSLLHAPIGGLIEGREGIVKLPMLLEQQLSQRQEFRVLRGDAKLVEARKLLRAHPASHACARAIEELEDCRSILVGRDESGPHKALYELLLTDLTGEDRHGGAREAILQGCILTLCPFSGHGLLLLLLRLLGLWHEDELATIELAVEHTERVAQRMLSQYARSAIWDGATNLQQLLRQAVDAVDLHSDDHPVMQVLGAKGPADRTGSLHDEAQSPWPRLSEDGRLGLAGALFLLVASACGAGLPSRRGGRLSIGSSGCGRLRRCLRRLLRLLPQLIDELRRPNELGIYLHAGRVVDESLQLHRGRP